MSFVALFFIVAIYAQSGFGIKGGYTYNADDGLFKTIDATYQAKGSGSDGYHLGVFKKFDLSGMYLQPEIWYVNYKNEFENQNNNSLEIQYKRIDVPVSLGTDLLKIFHFQGGAVLSYYFEDKINIGDISDIKQDDLAIGFQVGGGVSLDRFAIDLRYDFPLGERETEWVQDNNINFQTESSPKLMHLSLSYTF